MTKDEALRMAIEVFDMYGNKMNSAFADEAYQACKEALEPTVAELNDEYLRDTHVAYNLVEILNDPMKAYPHNFSTPAKGNALLLGLCQEAADEIERLKAETQEPTKEEILGKVFDAVYAQYPPKAETQEPKPPTILARLPNGATVSNVYEAYEAGLKEGKAETQEPMIIKQENGMVLKLGYDELPNGTAFYTTPPSREWQSLSDYLISELWYKSQNDIEGVNLGFTTQEHFFAGLIDANLREKNNG